MNLRLFAFVNLQISLSLSLSLKKEEDKTVKKNVEATKDTCRKETFPPRLNSGAVDYLIESGKSSPPRFKTEHIVTGSRLSSRFAKASHEGRKGTTTFEKGHRTWPAKHNGSEAADFE